MLGYSQEKEYDIELYYSSSRKIGTEERPATYKAAKYLVNKLNNMINFNPLHSLQTLLKHYDNNHVPAFVELWINEKVRKTIDSFILWKTTLVFLAVRCCC